MAIWHPELPAFAFLSALLVLVPLPWHWRARNVATMAMTFWFFIVGVIYGVNAVVWKGHARDVAPVYCDITTKIVLGASYAIPFATLCVAKHMEMVSSSRMASYTAADRKRRMTLEGMMCFGLPLVFMALHYVVQGHRYDIVQNLGCIASIYVSVPAIFIIWFPPLLSSTICLIYASLSLHHFIQRRLVFASHLQNSSSGLTTNRYLRLIAMAITTMFWGTIIHSYIFYINVAPGLRPWTNWADVHSGFSRVDKLPIAFIPKYFVNALLLAWWSVPASSIIFFLFFGFGEEATKEYMKLFGWVKKNVFKMKEPEKQGFKVKTVGSGTLPKPLRLVDFLRTNTTTFTSSTSGNGNEIPFSPTSSFPSTITANGSPPPYGNTQFHDKFSTISPTSTTFSSPSTPKAYSLDANHKKEWKKLSLDRDTNASGLDVDASDSHATPYFSTYTPQGGLSPATTFTPLGSVRTPPLPSLSLNPRAYHMRSVSSPHAQRQPTPDFDYHYRPSSSTASLPESVGSNSWTKSSDLSLASPAFTPAGASPPRRIPTDGVFGGPASPAPTPVPSFHRPFSADTWASVMPDVLPSDEGTLVTVYGQSSRESMTLV